MPPRVSIIIPTYNRANLLSVAITSVLKQKFTDFELLILDDASMDSTHEIVKPFLTDSRVRLIIHPDNIGITANRNYGLSIAQGNYIAMLDSDDVWLDDCKLTRQVELLDSHPELGIVGTFAQKIDADDNLMGTITHHTADISIRNNMMRKNQFIQSSVLIRKQALDDVGWYDENIPIWEDYELWLRIGTLYQFRNIPEFLTGYREHPNNISKESEKKSISAYWIIYKLYRKKYPYSLILLFKIIVKKILINF